MHRLAAVCVVTGFMGGLVACGGSPAPRAPIAPQESIATPQPVAPATPATEEVAVGDPSKADPCEGGEVTGGGGLGLRGTGEGGGGTGEGIGLGRIGGSGGGGSPGRDAPRVSDGDVSVTGSLDKAVIRRVVLSHRGAIRFCYESVLQKKPGLEGKVVVTFTIDPKGVVIAASAEGIDGDIETCLAARFRTMTFPQGPSNATIKYPFTFVVAK